MRIEAADPYGRPASGRHPHAPTAARGGERLRDVLSFAAVLATGAAVLGLFLVSPITLEARGIAYLSSGGGVFTKVHPATLLACAALVLRCLVSGAPARTAARLMAGDVGVVLLLGAVAIAAVFAVAVDKTPVTPLCDTFVLPVLVFLLLRDLDARASRVIAILVALVLVANAAIAIAEFLRGTHLIAVAIPDGVSDDPTRPNAVFSWQAELAGDWRATALLGHPLVNGLVSGLFVICLVAARTDRWPAKVVVPLVVLEYAAMFAFGGRAALVLTAGLAAIVLATRAAQAHARGVRARPRQVAGTLLVLGLGLTVALVLLESGYLDRTLARFTEDAGSASTRLTMFALVEPMSLADLVFKPDKDLVATLQRMFGLEYGIESSWVGLLLTYGAAVTLLLLVGLAAFARSVLQWSERGAGLALLYFFLLVSASASLSGKTTSFAMAVALILLFLRRNRPGVAARAGGMV